MIRCKICFAVIEDGEGVCSGCQSTIDRIERTLPPGFTEETRRVAKRFADLIEWYEDQGFDIYEAVAKAKIAMRCEGAMRKL